MGLDLLFDASSFFASVLGTANSIARYFIAERIQGTLVGCRNLVECLECVL